MTKEQKITNGFKETIDNLVLQAILGMIKDVSTKEGDMLEVHLNACPFCDKQRIVLVNAETEEMEDNTCIFCEKAVDEEVLVYEYEKDKQVLCLKSEALDLLGE